MTTMMVQCPECKTRYSNMPVEHEGKRMRCKRCGEAFVIKPAVESSQSVTKPAVEPSPPVKKPGPAPDASARPAATHEPAARGAWKPGELIGDIYEVVGPLGQGGFGTVHKVRHLGWNMDLAVKSPNPRVLASEESVQNFRKEAETWVGLGFHPNAVSCYYVREIQGIPRVFAEYIDGGSLKDWIRERKLQDSSQALDVAVQFARGLEYAHSQGLIHQDVKPANVMMTADGIAKVTDFGLAQMKAGAELGGEVEAGESVLVEGGGYCTPQYASPEQLLGGGLSRKTDIWSFGVSVLEMFTGAVTWPVGSVAGAALEDYLAQQESREYPLRMPDTLAALLRKCFEEEPARRPPDMRELAEDLEDIYGRTTGKPYPRPRPKAGPATVESLNNRALSLVDLDLHQEAHKLWSQALEMQPFHPEASYNLAMDNWRLGVNTDRAAMDSIREMLRKHEYDARSRYLAALVYLELDSKNALEILRGLTYADIQKPEMKEVWEAAQAVDKQERRLLTALKLPYLIWPSSLWVNRDVTRCIARGLPEKLLMIDFKSGTVTPLAGENVSGSSVCTDPDWEIAAWGDDQGKVHVWSLSESKPLGVFEGGGGGITAVAVSADREVIVSGDSAGKVNVWRIETGEMLRSFQGHGGAVRSVAVDRNGVRAVSCGADDMFEAWDLAGGRSVLSHSIPLNRSYRAQEAREAGRHFKGDHPEPFHVAISADGKTAAAGCTLGLILVWDLETGKRREMKDADRWYNNVSAMCMTQNGDYVITNGDVDEIYIWKVSSGRRINALHTASVDASGNLATSPLGEAWSISLTPDGATAVTGHEKGAFAIWQVDCGKAYRVPEMICRVAGGDEAPAADPELAIMLAEARRALSAGNAAGAARILRNAKIRAGNEIVQEIQDLWAECCMRLPRKSVSRTWQRWSRFIGMKDPVVAVSPDGRHVAAAGDHLEIHDAAGGECRRISTDGHQGAITCLCFSLCGRRILTGGADATLRLWDLEEGRAIRTFTGHRDRVHSVSLSGDGRLALSASFTPYSRDSDNSLRLWDVESGTCLRIIEGRAEGATSVALSADGSLAASANCNADKVSHVEKVPSAVVRDVRTGRIIECATGAHGNCATSAGLSWTGRAAAFGCDYGEIIFHDFTSPEGCWRMDRENSAIKALLLAPDGKFAVGAEGRQFMDHVIKLWDMEKRECVRTLEGHTSEICGIGMSWDSRFIASVAGGDEQRVRLWEVEWDVEERDAADWDQSAKPYLETFHKMGVPYAGPLAPDRPFSEEELEKALTRKGKPSYNEEDFDRLLFVLGCVGLGWIKPDGVRKQLNSMQSLLGRFFRR